DNQAAILDSHDPVHFHDPGLYVDRGISHLHATYAAVGKVAWAGILPAGGYWSHSQLGASIFPGDLPVWSVLDPYSSSPRLQLFRLCIQSRGDFGVQLIKRIQSSPSRKGANSSYSRATSRPAIGRIFVVAELDSDPLQGDRKRISSYDPNRCPGTRTQVL